MVRGKDLKNTKKKKGFTLAEVLINLIITGIIAALTVPTLLQNTQKRELKTGLKEAYSIISNAYNMVKLEQGFLSNNSELINYYNSIRLTNPSQLFIDLQKYMKVDKSCPSEACFVSYSAQIVGTNNYYKTFQGSTLTGVQMVVFGVYQCVLANGMYIGFENPNSAGGNYRINIDVNGFKPPNMMGKDVFTFRLTPDNRILPGDYATYSCKKDNVASWNLWNGCANAAYIDDTYWDLW